MMKVVTTINPQFARYRAFAESMPTEFESGGTVIYRGHNLIKTFRMDDGTTLNVKRFCRPKGPNLLIYSFALRKPKGERAFAYANILRSRGIGTPDVVALVEERGWLGLLGFCYLITIQVDYPHDLYEVGDAKPGEYEELGAAVGRFAASLHGKEVLHKDFTPGNILWRRDNGEFRFMLVDINRMAFRPVGEKEGLRSLCRLWGPKDFVHIVAEEYAKARGFDLQASVDYVMKERARFWKRYGRKHKIKFKLEL